METIREKRIKFLGGMSYGKTLEEHRAYMSWWRNKNKEDYNKKRLLWAQRNRLERTIQSRKSHLKIKFGMTIQEHDNLFKKQNYKCAICRLNFAEDKNKKGYKLPNLCVDHSHITKKIRGLLCRRCNTGLGQFKDSIEILNKAIVYLSE